MNKSMIFICVFFYINQTTNCFQSVSVANNAAMDKCILLSKDSIPRLHSAVLEGDIEKVKCLLNKEIDVMSLDLQDETALMYACKKNNTDFEIITLLIEHGSSVLYESPKTLNSAISICIKTSKVRGLQFLLDRLTPKEKQILRSNKFYLINSIVADEPEIVKQLIPYQEDLNEIYFMGVSPLESAINHAVLLDDLLMTDYDWKEKEEINFPAALETIDVLLSSGAKFNESDRFFAIVSQAFEGAAVIEFLIEKGLDLNKLVETHSGNHKVLDLFLLQFADKEIFNLQGQDVDLTQTKELEKYLEVLDLMIRKGAKGSFEKVTANEQLAMMAVDKNNSRLIKLLLDQKRVNLNFTDSEGKTLLERAQDLGFFETIEVLKKYN